MSFAATAALLLTVVGADDVTAVLPAEPPAAQRVYAALQADAHRAIAEREAAFAKLQSAADREAWQQQRREFFTRALGGIPERHPLHAEVVGKLQGDGFTVEKIIFQSRPQFHVTAALYLPETAGPHPAVLVCCGHSRSAKAAEYNQRICMLLARNGLAALCYDPVGQGERSQLLDAQRQPKHRSTTTEHTLIGVGAILVGSNTAQIRVFDGMRALDYLQTRDDIDGSRLGCTGCSGGGTLTSYLMALDERITCAAPACYLTTFRHLVDSIGPQDAEQNIHGQLAFGMDHADYILMRAPRPTLICATTRDYFDIRGSWETLRQAKRFYAAMGYPERVDLVEDDAEHGITQLNRETMVHWMKRWLLHNDDPVDEQLLPIFTEQQLRCTPTGQVLDLPGARSAFDLHAELAAALADDRERFWSTHASDEARAAIRGFLKLSDPQQVAPAEPQVTETIARDGYQIRKLIFDRGPHRPPIPALLLVPSRPAALPAAVYVHGAGKHRDLQEGGPLEQRVRVGQLVLAIDVSGCGELGKPDGGLLGGSWKEFFLAYLLDQSLLAHRIQEIWWCGKWLEQYESAAAPRSLELIGIGEAAIPALHAAALAPQVFSQLQLHDAPDSWLTVINNPEMPAQLSNVVHGALRMYDLPDLQRLVSHETSQNASFEFHTRANEIEIRLADRSLATYVFRDPQIPRPYFKHVYSPGGVQVTRTHPPQAGIDRDDHAQMHPGIWLAFGDLSGADFWRNRARVEHMQFTESPQANPVGGRFTVENRYLSDDVELCRETCRIELKRCDAGVLLDWTSTFLAADREIVFGDQEEMGLGLRMSTPLAVITGGRIRNSHGQVNEKQVWGKQAAWCEYSGIVDQRRAGLLLIPHPDNFRPSWFHARDYGFVAANPFGRNAFTRQEKSRVVVPPEEKFTLRFGILIFDVPADQELPAADVASNFTN